MQVQVYMNSARDLKNVNWRNGPLKSYAVVWIDTSGKCSTKADLDNGMNPKWNEKFTIPLRSTSRPETAILYIDVVHAIPSPNTKPLVGSVKLPLGAILMEAQANGKVARSLELLRPSGRPQGVIEIKIGVKDLSPGDQHIQQMPLNNQPVPPRVESQPRLQPQPQVQHHAQFHPQPQAQFRPQPQPQAQFHPQPQAQFRPQPQAQFHPQPQAQFHPQPQAQPQPQFRPQPQAVQFHPQAQRIQPSPRAMGPMYGRGHRPVGPSATEQICELGLNMVLGPGLPINRIMKLAQNYNKNNLPANNYVYVDGQNNGGGTDGNGYDLGGGYDNGLAPDMNNGYEIDSSGFDNGYGVDLGGSMGDSGFDVGGVDLGGIM